ncbi:unnamed protein product [Ectocarpus sp. 4 AP-2014]
MSVDEDAQSFIGLDACDNFSLDAEDVCQAFALTTEVNWRFLTGGVDFGSPDKKVTAEARENSIDMPTGGTASGGAGVPASDHDVPPPQEDESEQHVDSGGPDKEETIQSSTRTSTVAEEGENSIDMPTGGTASGGADVPASDHDVPPPQEDESEQPVYAGYGTVDLFFQIFAEVDKDPTSKDEFLDRVEKLVSEGVDVLGACRRLPRCQTNGFPRMKRNTVVLQNGKCQAGKGTETYIGFLKAWLQAGLVPIFQAKNDGAELGRHNQDMLRFNAFSARIWKLAGLDKREKPILDMFEDVGRYETGLGRLMDSGYVIPVYGLIDNPARMNKFREKVVPMIRELGTTDDGALKMCFFIDEADLTIRDKTTAGAKSWTDPLDEWESLPAACSSIVHVTATPAAIHLSENQMGSEKHGSKKHEFQEVTVSTFYWDYLHPSQELPPNARVISREIGDLHCMVRKMLSTKRIQCALAVQSSVSENADIDKQAKINAVRYAREGLICLAWTANQLIVYTSHIGMRGLFESGKFFKAPMELGDREVSKIERGLRKGEAGSKDAPKEKKRKRRKKGEKSSKRIRGGEGADQGEKISKRIKRGKGADQGEKSPKGGKGADKSGEEHVNAEQPEEEYGGVKQLPQVFRYVPARVKDNDYSPFITYVHDKIKEAVGAKKCAGEAEEGEEMVPKILTFSKVKAGRARSIKGSNHEWPLDHLFLDLHMHSEGVRQAAGRAQSVDRRPLDQGPTMWGSKAMQLLLTKSIIADQACREILRQGNTPLQVVRDLLKNANSLPEGGELVVKSGVLEAVGPTGHSRRGTCLAYAGEHTEVTRIVKRKHLVVLAATGDAKEKEEAESFLPTPGDAMEQEETGSVLLPPAEDAMEEEEVEEEEEKEGVEEEENDEQAGTWEFDENEEMETASTEAGADGDPEPDAAYWVSNHLEDILGTMVQALRERKTSMTMSQMADDIPGRDGYPTTNVSSLSIVQYIIEHHYDEMDAAGAYFLSGTFLP